MPPRPLTDEKNLLIVQAFPNQGLGMGYGSMRPSKDGVPEGYDYSVNMDDIDGQVLVPSFASVMSSALSSRIPPSFIRAWKDSNDVPLAIMGLGNQIRLIKDASQTLESNVAHPLMDITSVADNGAGKPRFTVADTSTLVDGDTIIISGCTVSAYNGIWTSTDVIAATTFDLTTGTFSATSTGQVRRSAEYTSADFFDDGSGVAYLYAGTNTGRKYLNRRNIAGVWSESSVANAVVATFVTVAGGTTGDTLYRTLNDYQVKYWLSGDPISTATWSAAYRVGTSTSKFLSCGRLGNAAIFAKDDGKIYAYDNGSDRFISFFETSPHALNFPFMTPDGLGGIWTSLWDGTVLHLDRFGNVDAYHPTRRKPYGRDTPRGRIVAAVPHGSSMLFLMDRGAQIAQPPGLTFLLTQDYTGALTAATFTDYSDLVTDGRYDTVADITNLDTLANGDALFVGADDKFVLIDFLMTAFNIANIRLKILFLTTDAGNGAGLVGNTWSNGTDMTPGSSPMAFGQSGAIVLDWTAFVSLNLSDWPLVTVNGSSKYWIQMYLE